MCARHETSKPPVAAWPCGLLAVLSVLATTTGPRTARAASGQLELTVVDRQTKQPIACRMHLRTAAGRSQRPTKVPFWHDHFAFAGKITLKLPLGEYFFELERGPEYVERTGRFTINRFADDSKEVDMLRFVQMSSHGWWSGDLYVRRPVGDIELLMLADDLHVAPVVTWANDKQSLAAKSLPKEPLVRFDRDRFYHLLAGKHTCPGGTLLYFNLTAPLDLAAAREEYPPPLALLERVGEQDGAWVDLTRPFWWDLPTLVAHGRIDSIQVAHSQLCRDSVTDEEVGGKPRDTALYRGVQGAGQWSQAIYFRLLECGLRIPPSAGSGSGEAPNPVGYNRLYVHVEGELTYQKWWENLRAGRVVITNGPLLRPRVRGELPGHVFQAEQGEELEFEIGLTLSTRKPISYLEIIKNGQVEHSVRFDEYANSGRLPKLHFKQSGWFLVRAVTDLGKTYRFAMTGPYYVHIGYQPRISRDSAQFFLEWVYERARQIKLDDPAQQGAVLEYHRQARDFWQDLLQRANAE
jgi:hypothetical protein